MNRLFYEKKLHQFVEHTKNAGGESFGFGGDYCKNFIKHHLTFTTHFLVPFVNLPILFFCDFFPF